MFLIRCLASFSLAGLALAGTVVLTMALPVPGTSAHLQHDQPATGRAAAAKKAGHFAGGNWQRGETLYRQNCAGCHGADLAGRCMVPPLLAVTRHMQDQAIVAHARKIGETMCCARHIGKLTDGEFAHIVAYFHAVDNDANVRRGAGQASAGRRCCCYGR